MAENIYHEKTLYRIKQKAKRDQEQRNRKEAMRRIQEKQTRMFMRAKGYFD